MKNLPRFPMFAAGLAAGFALVAAWPASANEGGEEASKVAEKACLILAEDAKRDESKLTDEAKQKYEEQCPQTKGAPLKPLKALNPAEAASEPTEANATKAETAATPGAETTAAPASPGTTRLGAFEDYPDETRKGMGAIGNAAAFRQGYTDAEKFEPNPKRMAEPAYAAGMQAQAEEAGQAERTERKAAMELKFPERKAPDTETNPADVAPPATASDAPALSQKTIPLRTIEDERNALMKSLVTRDPNTLSPQERMQLLENQLGPNIARNANSAFGYRNDPFTGQPKLHGGQDFRGAAGTPIPVTANGRVISSGWSGGFGNMVEVQHDNGVITRYAHLHDASNLPDVGSRVERGETIGLMGTTGRSTGNHLHYEVLENGRKVDPAGRGGQLIVALNNGVAPGDWGGPNSPVYATNTQVRSGLSTAGAGGGIRLGAYAAPNSGWQSGNFGTDDNHGNGWYPDAGPGPMTDGPMGMTAVPPNVGNTENPLARPELQPTPRPLTPEELKKQQELLDKELMEKLKKPDGLTGTNPNLLNGSTLDSILANEECKNLRGADLLSNPACTK